MPGRSAPATVADTIRRMVAKEPVDTTYSALAERVDVAEDVVRGAVDELKKAGTVRVKPAGRRGVRLEAAAPPTDVQTRDVPRAAARGGGRPAAKAAAPVARARKGARDAYCPWCGAAVASPWRFCSKCGKPLTEVR